MLLRDRTRAALISGLHVVLAYAFGLLREPLAKQLPESLLPHSGVIALGVWGFLFVALSAGLVVWSRRRGFLLARITQGLNVTAILLVALALRGTADGSIASSSDPAATSNSIRLHRPDIYYIVLDGYGGSETLREIYGLDNRSFLRALEERGFYVASDSYANYLRTAQSVASTLNMTYLTRAENRYSDLSQELAPLVSGIRNNRVMALLEKHGYRVFSFASGYGATSLRNSPRFVSSGTGLSEFENTLLNLTPVPAILSLAGTPDQYELHRRRIRYTLRELPRLSRRSGPKSVFAHIVAPHPPFVFDADGEPVANHLPFKFFDANHFVGRQSRREYLEQYAAQASFISDAILECIDGILAASPSKPVIILQGDHGPGVGFDQERIEHNPGAWFHPECVPDVRRESASPALPDHHTC